MGADKRTDVFTEAGQEKPVELEVRTQRPLEANAADYAETGFMPVGIGADGMPVMGGGDPPDPEPGLTEESLVCIGGAGRPECEFYGAWLIPADGMRKGADQAPMQVRRFCRRLATATEVMELPSAVYACTMRSPPDPSARAQLDAFEAKQKKLAAEAAETSGTLDF